MLNKFITKARILYGNRFDYSKVIYSNIDTKVIIVCKKHGEFLQSPYNHLKGFAGCKLCMAKKLSKDRSSDTSTFITKAAKIHNQYDYSKTNYINSWTKIKIICKKHGVFEQMPFAHLRGSGCPVCSASMGEKKIENYLKINKFEFIHEKKFIGCQYKRPLSFDFYLPQFKTIIEFDGRQHFKPVSFGSSKHNIIEDNLKNTIMRDQIKNDFCQTNDINLIRIPFYNINNIDSILDKMLAEKNNL